MYRMWAVARHTFAHCLRMKVAGVFLLLLGAVLVILPLTMTGDGTLAGQTRTFLSYGTSLTGVLLSLVTIFATVGVVTADVEKKYVFMVTSKPVARWQYVLGRWAGVVLFDAVLLLVAAVAMYGCAQYLRTTPGAGPEDRRVVETEVFTARQSASPQPLDIDHELAERINRLQILNEYDDAVEKYTEMTRGDRDAAEERLVAEIRKQILSRRQSAPPNQAMQWRFAGLKSSAEPTRGAGTVVAADRRQGRLLLKVPPDLLERVIHRGPIEINGVGAQVVGLRDEFVDVWFYQANMNRSEVAFLKRGEPVDVVIRPTVQITYKASPGGEAPGDTLQSTWQIQNPETGFQVQISRNDPVRIPATLTVPSQVISSRGETTVWYINRTPTSVTILHEDISILYPVGSFEVNFLKGVLLIFLQLVFLAAVAVFAATWLAFPVACMLCFVTLPFSMAREYLSDSVKLSRGGENPWYLYLQHSVVWFMNKLLPDFAQTSPADSLVKGMLIAWQTVGTEAFWHVAVRAALALVLACLIFRKRELGRVQV